MVAFSAFSGKNSAQNLINYIKILTAIINSYQSCSNSNDPLNILHECCDTNLLMISCLQKGGVRTPWTPPPLDLPLGHNTIKMIFSGMFNTVHFPMTRSVRYQPILHTLYYTLHTEHAYCLSYRFLNNVVITTIIEMVEMVEILYGRLGKRSVE